MKKYPDKTSHQGLRRFEGGLCRCSHFLLERRAGRRGRHGPRDLEILDEFGRFLVVNYHKPSQSCGISLANLPIWIHFVGCRCSTTWPILLRISAIWLCCAAERHPKCWLDAGLPEACRLTSQGSESWKMLEVKLSNYRCWIILYFWCYLNLSIWTADFGRKKWWSINSWQFYDLFASLRHGSEDVWSRMSRLKILSLDAHLCTSISPSMYHSHYIPTISPSYHHCIHIICPY